MGRYCNIASIGLTVAIVSCGCITDVNRNSDPVAIQLSPQPDETRVLEQPLLVQLRWGYSIDRIHSHTSWRRIGDIPQGQVFKPIDSVLMVDAGDRHEGFLVIRQNRVVGIFLPAESAFVAARIPITADFASARRQGD